MTSSEDENTPSFKTSEKTKAEVILGIWTFLTLCLFVIFFAAYQYKNYPASRTKLFLYSPLSPMFLLLIGSGPLHGFCHFSVLG